MTHAKYPYAHNVLVGRETNEYLRSLPKGTASQFIREALLEKMGKRAFDLYIEGKKASFRDEWKRQFDQIKKEAFIT